MQRRSRLLFASLISLAAAQLLFPGSAGAIDFRPNQIPHDFPFSIASGHSGLCWDVPNGRFFRGARIQQYPCRNSPNQIWNLIYVSREHITYFIRSAARHNFCVAHTADDRLVLDECSGMQLGEWQFHGDNHNFFFYRIAAYDTWTNKCIDIPNGSFQNSEGLQIYDCHEGPNQGWLLLPGQ